MKKLIYTLTTCLLLVVLLCPASASAWSLFKRDIDYSFKLNGDTFTVPFPVKELLSKGWEPCDDAPIDGKSSNYVSFTHSHAKETITMLISNSTPDSLNPSACTVTEAVVLLKPKGIFNYGELKPDSTIDEVIKTYGEPVFISSDTTSAIYAKTANSHDEYVNISVMSSGCLCVMIRRNN